MRPSVFVVDSSSEVREFVEHTLTPEGFNVIGFPNGPAALEVAQQINPVLIIADYHVANITFSGFCKEINARDSLSETHLISLITQADHPGEGHLRSLGVKTFLNKPLQSHDLLRVLKSLYPQQQLISNGMSLKRRNWPPSVDEENSSPSPGTTDPSPAQTQPMDQSKSPLPPDSPLLSASVMNQTIPDPHDAMRGLWDQLLLCVAKDTEKRLADWLPRILEDHLATHIRPIIEQEVQTHIATIFPAERISAIIHPILSQELPSLLGKEIANCEALIRQAVSDATGALVLETADDRAREQADAIIQKYLPGLIHEQAGSITQMVQDEVRTTVAQQTPRIVEDIVRTTAEQTIENTVRRIVPELAEQRIEAELKRLTASD